MREQSQRDENADRVGVGPRVATLFGFAAAVGAAVAIAAGPAISLGDGSGSGRWIWASLPAAHVASTSSDVTSDPGTGRWMDGPNS